MLYSIMMSTIKAIAVLKGDPGVSGVVTFEQQSTGGATKITGTIKGLRPGLYTNCS